MTSVTSGAEMADKGGLRDYLRIARLDHSAKHIFIIPGMVLAYLLRGLHTTSPPTSILLGGATALCVASANYVINEYLDRDSDRHHPTKSSRAAVQRELDGRVIVAEWAILVALGLTFAAMASRTMAGAAFLFALQGVIYNVPPVRTKNLAYLDVISESINNPLRLIIGWSMIDPTTLPPSSILLAYWLGGAFLMAAKRLSEFREIVRSHGQALLLRYRASFAGYTEERLTVSCFIYALLSSFFLAIFLIKYRVEYLLLFPVIVVLFAQYLRLSMKPGSSAQKPEKLYRERMLMALVIVLVAGFGFTTAVDLPVLYTFTSQRFISLP